MLFYDIHNAAGADSALVATVLAGVIKGRCRMLPQGWSTRHAQARTCQQARRVEVISVQGHTAGRHLPAEGKAPGSGCVLRPVMVVLSLLHHDHAMGGACCCGWC